VNFRRIFQISLLALFGGQPAVASNTIRCFAYEIKLRFSSRETTTLSRFGFQNPRVERWLQSKQAELQPRMSKAPGETLTVGNQHYKIHALLGSGFEGEAYLVRSERGFRVLKTFRHERSFKFNIGAHRAYDKEARLSLPRILKIDGRRHTVLLEYIEGIPYNDIRDRWQEIGLTLEERDKILNSITLSEWVSSPNESKNILYSFEKQKMFLIDSR
jgi:hypothetical protein